MSLAHAMRSGRCVVGGWIQLAHPQVTEILARSGLDFLVVDMEHTAITSAELLQTIQIGDLAGKPMLVRVGANDALLVKRAMDAGACGVIVPDVRSVAEAARAVSFAMYPPAGTRGVGLARAQGYGLEFDAYRERAADETVVIAQIEHHEAVQNLEAILDVEGITGFMIGPYDLSGSVGRPGEFDHAEVRSLMDRALRVMQSHLKPGGFHVVHTDPAALKDRMAAGARFLAYGTDMVWMAEKVRDAVEPVADREASP